MALLDEIRALDRSILDTQNETFIAAALNAPRSVVGAVSRQLFAMWAGQTGMRAAIEDAANDKLSPLRSIALTVRDFIQGAADNLDLSMQQNKDMLQKWIEAGKLSQEAHDALMAMATQVITGTVTEHQVRLECRDFDGNWVI
jgi:hypothetical protein